MTADEWEARVNEVSGDVDLSVAFSPVLPLRTGSHPAAMIPVKVSQIPDGYLIHLTGANQSATAAELRPMRARYLLRKEDLYLRLPTMGPRERERILNLWFDGKAVYAVGALTLAAGKPAGEPILTIPYEKGNPEAKAAAVQQAIEAIGPVVTMKSATQAARESTQVSRHLEWQALNERWHGPPGLLIGENTEV